METIHRGPGLAKSLEGLSAIGAALALLSCAQVSFGQTYEVVYAFRNPGTWCPLGEKQNSGLIRAADDFLYGTTCGGGKNGVGTIFRADLAGNLVTIHSFGFADGANPLSGLVQATDGNFYGTTSRGGTSNQGVVFRMDPSGDVTPLHSFAGPDGLNPYAALVQASDSSFYGTTYSGGAHSDGTVFRIDSSGTLTTVHSFQRYVDGANPGAELVRGNDNQFYGTTIWGGPDDAGTVFSMDVDGHLATLHNFKFGDGSRPFAGLIQSTDGNFYGTTAWGGTANRGTVFRVSPSGDFSSLHSFNLTDGANPWASLIRASDGFLYGTTARGTTGSGGWGTVFRIDSLGDLTTLHSFTGVDGANPRAALVEASAGMFYGTTDVAGMFWGTTDVAGIGEDPTLVEGTIFKMASSGELTTLRDIGWTCGVRPEAALVQAADGSLYGTTVAGGISDRGTAFRMDLSGHLSLIHSFVGSDGAYPSAAMIQANDGKFYGATGGVGDTRYGTIFRMAEDGSVTTLHVFSAAEGWTLSGLIQASDDKFYGTTSYGLGGNGAGTVFQIDSSANFATLWAFDPWTNGADPNGSLIEVNGKFYGTTSDGGSSNSGVVFRMTVVDGIVQQYSFSGSEMDGGRPAAALLNMDGTMFGTTQYGGAKGFGTIFRIPAESDDLETLHSFDGTDGQSASAPLLGVHLPDGYALYGTTADGGEHVRGTLFRLDSSGDFSLLHTFNGVDGMHPIAALVQANDGFLYGTAGGGPFGDGVIFRLTDAGLAVNEVTPTSGPASGGAAIDIVGGGFGSDATVAVGGTVGTDPIVMDPTFIYLLTPSLSPGTLNDVAVTNPGLSAATATRPDAYFADFLDVPQLDPFHDFVEEILRRGITAGCGAGSYCAEASVTRAQMAVFLLKSEHGSTYVPPPCSGVFDDVSCPGLFADWIEQLAAEGITAGCGGGNYCPAKPINRAQMAVFLLKTKRGAAYVPPPCTGVFGDVACPSLFADWIEQLAAEGITGGCGGGDYCPENPNTRGQMSAFLVKTFPM